MKDELDNEIKSRLMVLFNDEALCEDWLKSSKIPLGGLSPLAVLKTFGGKDKILDMIARIETGDLS
ncbi:MbcA/ParS/Xre antitoxin family protein [Aliivibrio sp. S4TY2]|uniref:MbcA/ParS/Xre antitoxin family protein n=1 Tax=unclassified Aliivibrio TaxID=2645654 RepID=UPI002378C2DF|nr:MULTISPECIES: MbcA/ParS/Xre antitoxin family protein [unclassified Aliivibrio]MDD9156740.1 MbcA/ParS/Xre antitoxin family protein [Aliivibrio sp. S4TY2]MDD9160226.1 MbcA/ParS/Xre antitoxin family protein [Aliivibrio sp. S4TY1]MDD9164481.1 MbcA/ParS/Xre antitoxin family protein [Aliivibrio sp. S4MY2]MDD9168649.1 MbcA/ParS/Xre antitoxin family protein [Aliivibrio sp. S4MY4]MDD9184816.1 MbcA/ParS/Xre antitoxin family protein [Aliivibrio sp. S4MY3]